MKLNASYRRISRLLVKGYAAIFDKSTVAYGIKPKFHARKLATCHEEVWRVERVTRMSGGCWRLSDYISTDSTCLDGLMAACR